MSLLLILSFSIQHVSLQVSTPGICVSVAAYGLSLFTLSCNRRYPCSCSCTSRLHTPVQAKSRYAPKWLSHEPSSLRHGRNSNN